MYYKLEKYTFKRSEICKSMHLKNVQNKKFETTKVIPIF